MTEDNEIKNLRDELLRCKRKYWEVEGRIKELNQHEEELKKELERVRDHLTYYRSLISDMKKRMQGGKTTDVFDRL